MKLFSDAGKVDYYITRKVQGKRQVMPKGAGKVSLTNNHFKWQGGRTYHIDPNAVQEDSGGHKYLEYDIDSFEPLSASGTPVGPDLKPHSSIDANTVLNRGTIMQVLGAVAGQKALSLLTIILMVMAGMLGYFAGSAMPISSLTGTSGTPVHYATYAYTSTYKTGSSTVTETILTSSTIPAGYFTEYSTLIMSNSTTRTLTQGGVTVTAVITLPVTQTITSENVTTVVSSATMISGTTSTVTNSFSAVFTNTTISTKTVSGTGGINNSTATVSTTTTVTSTRFNNSTITSISNSTVTVTAAHSTFTTTSGTSTMTITTAETTSSNTVTVTTATTSTGSTSTVTV